MDKYKKAKNAIYCIDIGEGKKKIEFLQIGKEWVQSKTVGGYGLKKGTFLSFVNHKWKQAVHRSKKENEFFIYSKEFCGLCGVDLKTPIAYAHEFNKNGFYELRKQAVVGGKAEINSFFYKPNGSFPVFNDAWNTPIPVIRPAELGGFGLTHGMVLFYLIDKCLLNKSETFKISQRQISGCFGLHAAKMVPKILDALAETEMVRFTQTVCELDLEFISVYFTELNKFWETVKAEKIGRADIQTALKDMILPPILDLVKPFK